MPRFPRVPVPKRKRRLLDLFRALFERAKPAAADDIAEKTWSAADHILAEEEIATIDPWDVNEPIGAGRQERADASPAGDQFDEPDAEDVNSRVNGSDDKGDWTSLENAERELVEIEDDLRERVTQGATDLDGETESLRSIALDEASDFVADSGEEDAGLSPDDDWSDWTEETSSDADCEIEPIDDAYADTQDLYELVEDISQNPWDVAPEDAGTRSARSKAASVAARLDTISKAEQEAAVVYLTELFTHLRHPSTFRAISALADDGLDLDTLKNVSALRRVWAETPEFWSRRGRYGVTTYSHGAGLLTWRLAHRVCVDRQELPPDLMIDDAWLWQWYALAPGSNAYLSFVSFLADKVDARDQERLHLALVLGHKSETQSDTADPFDWYRTVEDPDHAIDAALAIVNPFDPRPVSSLI